MKMELPTPLRASELQQTGPEKKLYWDRSHYESPESQMKALTKSSWLYVGNLSFSCRSVHVRAHFEQLGPVKEVIMGLDRNKKTPCGFCFVEYYQRRIALQAVSVLSGTKLDGSIIRVELDAGFQKGREFGRGVNGGQVRDDRSDRKRSRMGNLYRKQNAATSGDVTMDGALPSGREVPGSYGPSTEVNAAANNDQDDNAMEQDDEQPSTKRQKRE